MSNSLLACLSLNSTIYLILLILRDIKMFLCRTKSNVEIPI